MHHSHYYTKRIKEGEGGGGELTLLHTKRKYMYLFPKTFTDVKSSTLNSPHSLSICGAADRSGRSERYSSSSCCWGTIIDLTKYSFLGCVKAKTLSQKGGEKEQVLKIIS